MKKEIKKIDYAQLVANAAQEDYKIGNSVVILDTYKMDPVNDYEFTAYGNSLIFVMKGKGRISVDGVESSVQAPCVMMHLHGQRIRSHIESPVVQKSLVFSDMFIEDLYASSLRLSDLRTSIISNPVLPLNDRIAVKSVNYYFNTMKMIALYYDDLEGSTFSAKFLTLSVLYGPLYSALKKKLSEESFRSPHVSTKFFNLLDQHYKERQPLSFYANELNVSERHLYTFLHQTTGKSPGYWLEHYLFTEAKRLLEERDLSILQISIELNFGNCPSFCRFFKRKQGVTPKAYRKYLSK